MREVVNVYCRFPDGAELPASESAGRLAGISGSSLCAKQAWEILRCTQEAQGARISRQERMDSSDKPRKHVRRGL